MHLAGFEPAMSLGEADYESDAFGHLATDAYLELVGLEPTSIYILELSSIIFLNNFLYFNSKHTTKYKRLYVPLFF